MTSAVSRWREAAEARWLAGVPHGRLRTSLRWSLWILVFLFVPSVPFVVFDVLPERFAWTASPVLFLYAWTTLLSELRHGRPLFSLGMAVTLWAMFFVIEYIGVTTGYPFGEYRYTGTLGFAVAGVPLAIGAAWYAAITNSWRIAEALITSPAGRFWKIPLVAAVLTLAFDIALEPMASFVRDYWHWEEHTIPATNYVSWFLLSLLTVALLRGARGVAPNGAGGAAHTGALLYSLQIVLFLLTGIANGHHAPALVSLLLIAGTILVTRMVNGRATQAPAASQ